MPATLPLEWLILYADGESRKWREFFRANPQAMDLKTDIAHGASVRDLLAHIFVVEYLYTQRIAGAPESPVDELTKRAAADPFAMGEQAHAWYRDFLAQSDDAALGRKMIFQTLSAGQQSATRRKMFVHALLHSMRHWAQLATLVRQNGYTAPGRHDFMFTSGVE
jgi:uncharacterized damage-inducible protein DinB